MLPRHRLCVVCRYGQRGTWVPHVCNPPPCIGAVQNLLRLRCRFTSCSAAPLLLHRFTSCSVAPPPLYLLLRCSSPVEYLLILILILILHALVLASPSMSIYKLFVCLWVSRKEEFWKWYSYAQLSFNQRIIYIICFHFIVIVFVGAAYILWWSLITWHI